MPFEPVRAVINRMVVPPQSDTVTERIAAILQTVPEGVLRALARNGTVIRIKEEDVRRGAGFDPGSRRVIIPKGLLATAHAEAYVKLQMGWAFNNLLAADYVRKNGGDGHTIREYLSKLSSQYPGHRDADRVQDCWRSGDTLDLFATRSPEAMFATGFRYFCTAALREEFARRAPGLFALMSEFCDRYDEELSRPEPSKMYESALPNVEKARTFARKMLIHASYLGQRQQVVQYLEQVPIGILELLDRHGVRIRALDDYFAGEGGDYDAGQRRITIRATDRGLLMHEIGHAIDHILLLETAAHDPTVNRAAARSERAVYPYRIYHFTELGRTFPNRYPLADKLVARWRRGQKVSRYAQSNLGEWFAESFRSFYDAGARAHISAAQWKVGDGTRATLIDRDPQFVSLLQELLGRVHSGIDLGHLKEHKLPLEPAVVFGKGEQLEMRALPQHATTATVFGRRGNDAVLARDADGTIIEVDRELFGKLVEPPRMGESISIGAQNGKLYALTERQTRPQTRGVWFSRTTRCSSERNSALDISGVPAISPRGAEPVPEALTTLTATILGRSGSPRFPWSKTRDELYLSKNGRIVKVDLPSVCGAGILKPGDTITFIRGARNNESASWRVKDEERVNIAHDAARVGGELCELLAQPRSSGVRPPRRFNQQHHSVGPSRTCKGKGREL